MQGTLAAIADRLRPELGAASPAERVAGMADVIGSLYAIPVAVLGLLWLVIATDLALLRREWLTLSILLSLILVFERQRFFVYLDIRGFSVGASGSLSSVAVWSGVLLFGPSALWLSALPRVLDLVREGRDLLPEGDRWDLLRNFALGTAATVPTGLFALTLYERWGGVFPLSGLSLEAILPAIYTTAIWAVLAVLVYVPFVLYLSLHTRQLTGGSAPLWLLVQVASVGLIVPVFAAPFGVVAAGLHAQSGLAGFLLFMGGLLMGGLLAHLLSRVVERSQQRSRELERLEQLGQAILSAPPDASTLPELLAEHVPVMFPGSRIEIRSLPDRILLRHPPSDASDLLPEQLWDWIRTTGNARCFMPHEPRPWDAETVDRRRQLQEPLVTAPLIEAGVPTGGVCVVARRDIIDPSSLLPAVQSLAAQVSSALHGARVYRQTLAHQRVEQELALAGEIQARFLPAALPVVPGWQLAAILEPARQTSGDFYDVIPLPNGRLGILVADVADKGMGAALFMALSRTLIRTYAVEHHNHPDFALRVANNRILSDTQVDLFVTAFYGVLDPRVGTLTYCNAGHNPPLLLGVRNDGTVHRLTRTGMPLGIFRGQTWQQRSVRLEAGDVLVLYTDGVTEAQDRQRDFFGEERLLAVAQAHQSGSADEIAAALMQEIQDFTGDQPQFDDIALVVLVREG